MEAKSDQCYRELSEAQESHNQVMDSLMRESEEFREQLSHEKELRLKNQHLRDSNMLEIAAFNESVALQQQTDNKYLSQGKQKYEKLVEKVTQQNVINEIKVLPKIESFLKLGKRLQSSHSLE